jgi:hypothetical protein
LKDFEVITTFLGMGLLMVDSENLQLDFLGIGTPWSSWIRDIYCRADMERMFSASASNGSTV